jgi:type II secretory pathway component PulC
MSAIKKIVFTLLFFSGFIIFSNQIKAQIPDESIQSLKSGDSKTLSSYFNQNVEMVVLENDNVYSKAQAQQIVSKFFSNNAPESFNVIHQGGKEGAQYVIGNLVTGKGTYRVYFLLKKSEGKEYIHQLRIESQ